MRVICSVGRDPRMDCVYIEGVESVCVCGGINGCMREVK